MPPRPFSPFRTLFILLCVLLVLAGAEAGRAETRFARRSGKATATTGDSDTANAAPLNSPTEHDLNTRSRQVVTTSFVPLTSTLFVPAAHWAALQRTFACWAQNGTWVTQDHLGHNVWRWLPSPECPEGFRRINSNQDLCATLFMKRLRIIGDQHSAIHAGGMFEFMCNNGMSLSRHEPGAKDADGWDPIPDPSAAKDVFGYNSCKICSFDGSKGQMMSFARSDRLLLDSDESRKWASGSYDGRWSDELRYFDGLVLLNRGGALTSDSEFLTSWRTTLDFIREKAPHVIPIVQTAPLPHENCAAPAASGPLTAPDPNLTPTASAISRQNQLLKSLLRDAYPGISLLDIAHMTSLRPDLHAQDCVYYNSTTYVYGSPYMGWTDLLGSMMLHLLPQVKVPV